MGFYPIPLPKDSALSWSSKRKARHRTDRANGGNDRVHCPGGERHANRSGEPRTAELNTLHSSKILEAPEKGRSESAALVEFGALQFFVQVDHQIVLQQTPVVVPVKRN